jgi:hypothetical protein
MASDAQSTEHELLKTGLAVGFRIIGEELLTTPEEAEFRIRLELKFVAPGASDFALSDGGKFRLLELVP